MKKNKFPQSNSQNSSVYMALQSSSYYGKDLLEASGKSAKASFVLRDIVNEMMQRYTTWPSWANVEKDHITIDVCDRIKKFSEFVYEKENQSVYFLSMFIAHFEKEWIRFESSQLVKPQ